ncbi:MAG: YeeE/YedE family protein [Nitrosomonas sp.]|uniref:YeeE/YedE family protein n=1 Tax=Nitrosomonas sp. TaxID=42353 RepID=UPI0025CD642D|nr:YeeE/YedE family protein [Nitrosomonas sp.]MBY0473770.1 YeeE/YedE family protein [Nitrosomonas sp.]
MVGLMAWVSGIVFGLGIILSGMVNPAIVLAFLDVTGRWDPSLAWVMVGAVAVGSLAFAIAKKRKKSYLGESMQIPGVTKIDARLILGGIVFGIGWGIAGICPGPALVLVGSGSLEAIIFLAAMLLGMGVFEAIQQKHQ